jgi:hypothetical protein
MLEQAMWVLSQRPIPLQITGVGVVSGADGPEQWRAGLDAVQAHHPLLRAAAVDGPDGPRFTDLTGVPVPLTTAPATGDDWTAAVVAEMATPFPAGPAPMLRARLLTGERRSAIILTGHTAIDGLSLAIVLRDLLRAMAGRAVTSSTHSLPMEHFLLTGDDGGRQSFAELVGTATSARMMDANHGTALVPHVERLVLGRELTELICDRAHQEEVTVHCILAAALAESVDRLRPGPAEHKLRVGSQVHLRRIAPEIGDSVGFYSIPVVTEAERDLDLWASARRFKADLGIFRQAARASEALIRIGRIGTSLAGHPGGWEEAVARTVPYDILLTNLGVLPIPLRYGPLRLEEVWGPTGMIGFDGEQVVGVTTLEANLNMLYASRQPVHGLMTTVRDVLAAAM